MGRVSKGAATLALLAASFLTACKSQSSLVEIVEPDVERVVVYKGAYYHIHFEDSSQTAIHEIFKLPAKEGKQHHYIDNIHTKDGRIVKLYIGPFGVSEDSDDAKIIQSALESHGLAPVVK